MSISIHVASWISWWIGYRPVVSGVCERGHRSSSSVHNIMQRTSSCCLLALHAGNLHLFPFSPIMQRTSSCCLVALHAGNLHSFPVCTLPHLLLPPVLPMRPTCRTGGNRPFQQLRLHPFSPMTPLLPPLFRLSQQLCGCCFAYWKPGGSFRILPGNHA